MQEQTAQRHGCWQVTVTDVHTQELVGLCCAVS